jgi:hypothetical protein
MIKYIFVVTSFLLAILASPAFAHNPDHAKDCAKEGETITNLKIRNEFLTSCLKKIDMSGFQMGEKAEQCIQNAKNMKLEGDKKDAYFQHCYLEDDAHPNATQVPHPKL